MATLRSYLPACAISLLLCGFLVVLVYSPSHQSEGSPTVADEPLTDETTTLLDCLDRMDEALTVLGTSDRLRFAEYESRLQEIRPLLLPFANCPKASGPKGVTYTYYQLLSLGSQLWYQERFPEYARYPTTSDENKKTIDVLRAQIRQARTAIMD